MSELCRLIYELIADDHDDNTSIRLEYYTSKNIRYPRRYPMFLGQLLEVETLQDEKKIVFVKVTKYENGNSEIILANSVSEIIP